VYGNCGPDEAGRSIYWVRARPIPVGYEAAAFRSGLLMWVALHDAVSLREGVTFVMDSSQMEEGGKTGNEARMQAAWQSLPLRPQHILILGADTWKRLLINGLIKAASVVIKQKMLQRIAFITPEELEGIIPVTSRPTYVGGGGGGVLDVLEWAKARYRKFETPGGLYQFVAEGEAESVPAIAVR